MWYVEIVVHCQYSMTTLMKLVLYKVMHVCHVWARFICTIDGVTYIEGELFKLKKVQLV